MQGYYPNNNSYSNSVMTVFVDGEAGANAYPVAAGYTVMLIDFNSGKFWITGTDPNGVPQRMRTFDFKEKIVQPQPPANFDGVSRQEFSELSAKLDKLISELGGTK